MAFEQIGFALGSFGIDTINLVPNIVIAVILLFVGLIVGKFVKWLLKKVLISGMKLKGHTQYGILETTLTVVKWIIYIVFIQAALVALRIPILSEYLSVVLGIIPGLIGSIVILVAGFAIARYVKVRLEKIKSKEWAVLSDLLFVYIVFVSLAIAVRASFIGSEALANNIILIITGVGAAAIAWSYIKKKR